MPIYVLAAYAVFWIFTFALVVSIWVRQRRIKEELEVLEQRLERTRSIDN